MKALAISAFLLAAAPMFFCAVSALRAPAAPRLRAAALFFSALAAVFFMSNPHRDVFTGLDVARYRKMADDYSNGRSLKGRDAAFAQVPETVRPSLFCYEGPERPTRDGISQLNLDDCETVPFFAPLLPLAAAGGAALGLPCDLFAPLIATLWAFCIFGRAAARGGIRWAALALALLFATPWPAWFLRGFFAEAAGAAMLGAAISCRAFAPRGNDSDGDGSSGIAGKQLTLERFVAGLLLGLAVSFHITLCVIAAPIAFCIVLRDGKWRGTLALALGGAAGCLPLLLITKFVCQPYGDFFNPAWLGHMLKNPVIAAVAMAFAAAAVFGCAALAFAHNRRARNFFDAGAKRAGLVSAICICCVFALPFAAGGILREGAAETFDGVRWAAPVFAAAAFLFLRGGKTSTSAKLLLAFLCAASLPFLFIKGSEIAVGIWSQRRFAPIVTSIVSLLSCAAGEFGATEKSSAIKTRAAAIAAPLLLLLATLANIAAFLPAYTVANGRGGKKITDFMEDALSRLAPNAAAPLAPNAPLTLFDYMPHSIPYQQLDRLLFGMPNAAGNALGHAGVFAWAAEQARERPLQIVSSYHPSASLVEDGVWLRREAAIDAEWATARAKSFHQISRHAERIRNAVYSAVPFDAGNRIHAAQEKIFDGGPLGLRAPWGRAARGGVWSRQGSGIIGALPPPGGEVKIEIKASWFPPEPDWTAQTLIITPPFDAPPLELSINGEAATASGVIKRASGGADAPPFTGVYRLAVARPYAPSAYGDRGYDSDLGVAIESIAIQILPPSFYP